MLERMDRFFENRLAGYDEHMRTNIEGAAEFYRYTAKQLPVEAESKVLDLGCGTGLELEEYFPLNPKHIMRLFLLKRCIIFRQN